MVEVFKTNVLQTEQSHFLANQIASYLPGALINFDLEDCDKILRIEADDISSQIIIDLLNNHGFQAEMLI